MDVRIDCHLSKSHPGIVYASVTRLVYNDQEMEINATLDYCLSACIGRGYNIINGQEVLMWLHKNANFVGYTIR